MNSERNVIVNNNSNAQHIHIGNAGDWSKYLTSGSKSCMGTMQPRMGFQPKRMDPGHKQSVSCTYDNAVYHSCLVHFKISLPSSNRAPRRIAVHLSYAECRRIQHSAMAEEVIKS